MFLRSSVSSHWFPLVAPLRFRFHVAALVRSAAPQSPKLVARQRSGWLDKADQLRVPRHVVDKAYASPAVFNILTIQSPGWFMRIGYYIIVPKCTTMYPKYWKQP